MLPERTAKTKKTKKDEMSPMTTPGCCLEALSNFGAGERGSHTQKDLTVLGKYEFEYLYLPFNPQQLNFLTFIRL